nr:hypothetical protein Q903MT_gene5039 [Picea sitchensis]
MPRIKDWRSSIYRVHDQKQGKIRTVVVLRSKSGTMRPKSGTKLVSVQTSALYFIKVSVGGVPACEKDSYREKRKLSFENSVRYSFQRASFSKPSPASCS